MYVWAYIYNELTHIYPHCNRETSEFHYTLKPPKPTKPEPSKNTAKTKPSKLPQTRHPNTLKPQKPNSKPPAACRQNSTATRCHRGKAIWALLEG